MVKHKRTIIVCAIASFLAAFSPTHLFASLFFGEDNYVVPARDTVDDDLYLATGEADIIGTVQGDLIIGANRYNISGEITGSLNSASRFATLEGTIENSVRVFAQRIAIDGRIGNNLIALGSDIELGRSSFVGRDATIFGSDISVSGEIGDQLYIRADQVIISGKVGGDVDIKANRITVVAPAEIMGDIRYTSKKKIKIDDEAYIGGEIDWNEVKPKKKDSDADDAGISFELRFMLFLASLATGLIIIPLFNHHTREAADQVIQKSLASLGIGFVFICIAPIAVVVLMITLVGIPAAITLLFAYTVFFYISKIYVAIGIGRFSIRAFKKGAEPKQGWSLLFGLIILLILFSIPVIGWIAYFATIFCGVGAIILGIRRCRQTPQPEVSTTPSMPPPEAV